MSEPNLKQRAHDAAIDHGMWLAADDDETNYQAFIAGYYRGWSDKGAEIAKADLAAAEPQETEIAELRAELAKVTEQRDAWPKYHGRANEGLMILHDRKDLQDLAGLRCGDFVAGAVPRLVAEYDRLRARVAELEGMVPRWVPVAQKIALDIQGWLPIDDQKCGQSERLWLMVPPIPLPEAGG